MSKFFDKERRTRVCENRVHRCVKFAKDSSRDYIETGLKEFKQLRVEAMQDARYWKEELAGVSA